VAQLKSQEQTNKIAFDEITFKLDRTFQAGFDLPVPKLPEMQLKAGPKASEVQDISIKAPNAWLKVVDENRFLDLLAQAAIKQSCIDDLIAQKYSVVSKAAIAENYDISVTEKSGRSFALSAAVAKGDLQMNGGGDAGVNLDEVIKKASAIPVVVGVDFFNPALLSQNRAKLVAPVFSATAQTRTTARALEQLGGRPLWQEERVAPLGDKVPLIRQGGGGNGSCGHPSSVQLASVVSPSSQVSESLDSKQFDISTSGSIVGGQTGHQTASSIFNVGNCVAIPETVEAQVSFDSSVKITVKSDTATTMEVSVTDLPSTVIQVLNWRGQDLEPVKTETPLENDAQRFKLSGAGVYELRLNGTQEFRATGTTTAINRRGTFTATIQ
jgi:hypothetical protein